MSGWADLDKLAIAKPRSDGRATLIARDDRAADAIAETRALTTLVAICRVLRGRRAIADKHGGRGVIIYTTTCTPPSFLVDAVSAAGGTVFDGTREHANKNAQATTVQLDAAFCDLATVVRRRFKVGSFGDALDMLEREIRQRPRTPDDPSEWWRAIFELAALTGELLRAQRPGKWIEVSGDRFPVALDRGKGEVIFPGKLAHTLVELGDGSMRMLVEAAKEAVEPPPLRPKPPSAFANDALEFARPMPLLCHRKGVPIHHLTWTRLVREEVDTPDMPVIVYVDDGKDIIRWPTDKGEPSLTLKARALENLAKQPFELTPMEIPHGKLVIVTGGFFGAEGLLDRKTMQRVRAELGGPKLILVGVPARGHLIAIDGERATIDDDFQLAFLMMIEREHMRATERDRISTEAVVYFQDEPIGRVQSNLMDARRMLRSAGVDPDAPDPEPDA